MGSLLDSLGRLWGRPRTSKAKFNRRNAARHDAIDNRARISWWIGEECFDVPGRIRDIGMLGASLLVDGKPPADHLLWIRLEEPCRTDWIEVTSVRGTKADEIGVVFPENCPYDLFKTMVPGYLLTIEDNRTTSKEFETRYWR